MEKSRKMPIVCENVSSAWVTFSTKLSSAWVVLRFSLNPNWKFENISLFLKKFTVRIYIILSKTLEIEVNKDMGLFAIAYRRYRSISAIDIDILLRSTRMCWKSDFRIRCMVQGWCICMYIDGAHIGWSMTSVSSLAELNNEIRWRTKEKYKIDTWANVLPCPTGLSEWKAQNKF